MEIETNKPGIVVSSASFKAFHQKAIILLHSIQSMHTALLRGNTLPSRIATTPLTGDAHNVKDTSLGEGTMVSRDERQDTRRLNRFEAAQ